MARTKKGERAAGAEAEARAGGDPQPVVEMAVEEEKSESEDEDNPPPADRNPGGEGEDRERDREPVVLGDLPPPNPPIGSRPGVFGPVFNLPGFEGKPMYYRTVLEPVNEGEGEPLGERAGWEGPYNPVNKGYFALTPFSVPTGTRDWVPAILDQGSKEGKIRWEKSTKPLADELYDCSTDGFYQFMQDLRVRADVFGWNGSKHSVLMIPEDYRDRSGPLRSILDSFGTMSLQDLTDYEKTYAFSQTRLAQDNRALFDCLYNSITQDAKSKLMIWSDQFELKGHSRPFYSGVLFLKVIIRESHLDTNATTSVVRNQLMNLDAYMGKVGNDISKFNTHVQILVHKLAVRGEQTNDLLVNLFRGYGACSDRTFVEYMQRQQEKYDEGEDITPTRIMDLANAKYRQMKDKGIWEAPTPEDEKISALQAQLEKVRANIDKKKATKAAIEQKNKKRGAKSGQKGHGKKKKQKNEKPKWMYEVPKTEDLKKPKKWNDKDWYWCGPQTGGKCKPPQYRCHKPEDCKGPEYQMRNRNDNKKNAKAAKKVTIQEAIDEISDGEDYST